MIWRKRVERYYLQVGLMLSVTLVLTLLCVHELLVAGLNWAILLLLTGVGCYLAGVVMELANQRAKKAKEAAP